MMQKMIRSFFIALSDNSILNAGAKRWGLRLGADQFVAGNDINSTLNTVKQLNEKGIACTIDHLGEFVSEKNESIKAKENILQAIEKISSEKVECHLSVKLTQLGLYFDDAFCLENMIEIVEKADKHNIFVNIDTEDYLHYERTLDILKELRKEYDNVGTVMQSYLLRAEDDMKSLKDVRLRLVKGAYKESESVAYQDKEDIDANFLKLAKIRLKGHTFTSIATHDHHIINEIKGFIHKHKELIW